MSLDGPIDSLKMARAVGVSLVGCPYRGTMTCWVCPLAPVEECDYKCDSCEHRAYCKCGWDQTERLQAWGLVE